MSRWSLLSFASIAFAFYVLWSANSQFGFWNHMPGSTDHPAHPAPFGTIASVGLALLSIILVQNFRISALERAMKDRQAGSAI